MDQKNPLKLWTWLMLDVIEKRKKTTVKLNETYSKNWLL